MGRQLVRILLMIIQWVVVPVGLVVLGYYVIGPRLGAGEDLKSTPTESTETGTDAGDNKTASRKFAAPKVEINVRRGSSFNNREMPRPRRKKKKPVETTTTPAGPKVTPPVDPDPPVHHSGEGDGGTGQETIPVANGVPQ